MLRMDHLCFGLQSIEQQCTSLQDLHSAALIDTQDSFNSVLGILGGKLSELVMESDSLESDAFVRLRAT